MARTLLVADRIRSASEELGEAMLIEAGRIVAVGGADTLRSPSVDEISYPGATIVPGLRDAHLHPVGYAAALQRPSLKDASDFDAIADILNGEMASLPAGTALTGLRLDDESLAEGRLPDRHLLDSVSRDSPIIAVRYCGHVAVANTAALELAGIGPTSPDPPGGVIDRDEGGAPTGVLRETAIEPVTAALRPLAPPLTADQVAAALTALAGTGLTMIGAMAATDTGLWGGAVSELDLLLEAAQRSAIHLRVFVIAPTPEALEAAAGRIDSAGSRATFAGVKMFSDGSFGGHTAAMHAPFSDMPGERGTDRLDPEWAREMATKSLQLGGRVAIHAIGDRANTGVLDLMEDLISAGADPSRLRVEHASVLTEEDIARFGRLEVTASVQPAFIASETTWLEKRVGAERLDRTYPFRSLSEAGAPLAGGSDSPVEPPHPLHGMAAARDRLGITPQERLSAEATLDLFTQGAAGACGDEAGLEPGMGADLTILDVDPAQAAADDLRAAGVAATWVGGAAVNIPADLVAWQA